MRALLTTTVMALALFGCAAGSDDPTPAPPEQQPGVDPPAETFSGVIQQPEARIVQISDRQETITNLQKQVPPNLPGR
jgi:hypothetical protein